jgi:hypothetical protein
MIALSKNDVINYTDSDGNTFNFLPNTGAIEREYLVVAKLSGEECFERMMDYFDKVVIGWSGPHLPPFPQDKKGSNVLSSTERLAVLELWQDANKLSRDQKKS